MSKTLNKLKNLTERYSYSYIEEIVLSKLKERVIITESSPPPHHHQMDWVNLALLALCVNNKSTRKINTSQYAQVCQEIFLASNKLIPQENKLGLQWIRVLINQQMLYQHLDPNAAINSLIRNHIIANRCTSLSKFLNYEHNYNLLNGAIIQGHIINSLNHDNELKIGDLLYKTQSTVPATSVVEFIKNNTIPKEEIQSELSKIEILSIDSLHRDTPLKKYLFYSQKTESKLTAFSYSLLIKNIQNNLLDKINSGDEANKQEFHKQFERYIIEYISKQNISVFTDEMLIEKYKKKNISAERRSNTDGCFLLGKTLYLIEVKAIRENDFIKSTTNIEKVKLSFSQSLSESINQIINTTQIIKKHNLFRFNKVIGITVTLEEFYLINFARDITHTADIHFEIPNEIKTVLDIKDIHIMSADEFERYFNNIETAGNYKLEELLKLRQDNILHGYASPKLNEDRVEQKLNIVIEEMKHLQIQNNINRDIYSSILYFNQEVFG